MNADERTVMLRLLDLVKARGTSAGHLSQQVPWEHRGACPHDRCAPSCLAWRQAIRDAERVLHQTLVRPRRAAG